MKMKKFINKVLQKLYMGKNRYVQVNMINQSNERMKQMRHLKTYLCTVNLIHQILCFFVVAVFLRERHGGWESECVGAWEGGVRWRFSSISILQQLASYPICSYMSYLVLVHYQDSNPRHSGYKSGILQAGLYVRPSRSLSKAQNMGSYFKSKY